MNNTYCVIMAGGVGTRFWPMSRNARPKQFLDILGTGKSLLQQTVDRMSSICPHENIIIVTHADHAWLVKEQLPQLPQLNILAEPLRRNTAPCIAYAAHKILRRNPKANIIVAPSDHIILNEEAFRDTIKAGLEFTSANDSLLTIGIKPSRPDTGYGYIQFLEPSDKRFPAVSKVITFTEKPNADMAKFFLQSGDFLWNAGIFLWSLDSILKAFREHLPEMELLFHESLDVLDTPEEASFIQKAYEQCTNISIDFAVMEKARNVFVIGADLGWSDLGTWGSLYEYIPHDNNGNALVGKNVMLYDTSDPVINVPKDKLVVLQGLKDYIVVESDQILLVCRKEDEQQIRQFVNDVKLNKGERFI